MRLGCSGRVGTFWDVFDRRNRPKSRTRVWNSLLTPCLKLPAKGRVLSWGGVSGEPEGKLGQPGVTW